jgi:Tfp pilus assembly protein PilF
VQELSGWEAGFRYALTEGSASVQKTALAAPPPGPRLPRPAPEPPAAAKQAPARGAVETTVEGDNTQALGDTWLLDPVPLPETRRGPGFVLLTSGEAPALPRGVPLEIVDLAAAPPETAASYAILRRYLVDWRGPLETPWLLLIDAASRLVKSYARLPDAKELQADLAGMANPEGKLPFPGRYFRGRPERNHYRFGAAYLGAGYPERALPYLHAAVGAWPGNFKAHLALGQLHLDAGRLAEAQRSLELAAAILPSSPDVWNNLGGVEMARNRYREALAYFDKALAIDGTRPYLLANAAQARARLGQNQQAEALFRRALAADAKDADVADQLGLLLAQQGRAAEAKELFQQAIRNQRDHASAINNLAVLYLQAGQRDEAAAALEYGIQVAPDNELLYLNLARLWVSTQNRLRARDVLNRLLDRNPNSQVARRALDQLGER